MGRVQFCGQNERIKRFLKKESRTCLTLLQILQSYTNYVLVVVEINSRFVSIQESKRKCQRKFPDFEKSFFFRQKK